MIRPCLAVVLRTLLSCMLSAPIDAQVSLRAGFYIGPEKRGAYGVGYNAAGLQPRQKE